MKSVRSVFKIGVGPSSSHTMGPNFAAKRFFNENPDADSFKVILYGSLAKTGKGHGTDRAVMDALLPKPSEVVFCYDDVELEHPNTLEFLAYKDGVQIANKTFLS